MSLVSPTGGTCDHMIRSTSKIRQINSLPSISSINVHQLCVQGGRAGVVFTLCPLTWYFCAGICWQSRWYSSKWPHSGTSTKLDHDRSDIQDLSVSKWKNDIVPLLLITFMEALGTDQCDWVLIMSGILNIISISSILVASHRNYDSIKTSNFHPAPYISNWHINPFANYVFWFEIQKLSHLTLV